MVTIRDVAKLANVSISTVSRVINNTAAVEPDTKQRVLDAVAQTGYTANVMAKALKKGRTNTIAFVIPNLENMIYPALATAVEEEAHRHGYFVLFCHTHEEQNKERVYVDKLKGNFVDGFLFSTALMGEESQEIVKLRKEGFPTVCLMREPGDTRDSIVSANYEGGYMGTKYLLERGLREIAVIKGRDNLSVYPHRLEGYKAALQEWGIPFDPTLCLSGVREGLEDGSVCLEEYFEIWKQMPEAVFALSDPLAFDAMIILSRLGYSVPEDVSVLGFDNVHFAENYQLTTVGQQLGEMARVATRRLIELIENPETVNRTQMVFPVSLVERNTVANKN